jgi:hypothetical protein
MKRISSSFLWAVAKLCAILAAILGCSSKAAPEKPRVIRWQGKDSGYENTTAVQPTDNAGSTGNK